MRALPAGVTAQTIKTDRLNVYTLNSGGTDGIPVVFVHGNVSSGRFYAELMAELPEGVSAWAPDLRGYGKTEVKPIDATRGVRDFADDIGAFLDAVGIGTAERPVHLVGWSVGGGVVMQVAIDRPEGVASLTLEAPMSPYGFGGSKDANGTECHADGAGAGGGLANPDFVKRLGDNDTSADADTSPRNILRAFYVEPSFSLESDLEDAYVDSMLQMTVGESAYPGDVTPSENWPMAAPGTKGTNNAIARKYLDLSGFADIEPRPPVLWIRGENDLIVSDNSMFDAGALGKLGAIPGWPGDDVMPPQPMIAQTRTVLDRYSNQGGSVTEEVLPKCGHSPHLEHADRFRDLLVKHIGA